MPRGRPKKSKETELAELIQQSADIESEEVELVPVEQVEIMSLSQLQEEKQKLATRRNQVMLKLDKRRIAQLEKIIDAMDVALNQMIGCYDENGVFIPPSAMDYKMYGDGFKSLMTSYNMVSRIDSIDSGGKAGSVELRLETPDGKVYGKVEW